MACFVCTAMLAFVVLVGPSFVERRSRIYERSRWMLFAAMSLFTLHFFLQMRFGFRATSADIGALVNFVFYAPVGFLTSMSQLNLEYSGRNIRHYWAVSAVGYGVMLAVIAFGRWRHGSWHIGEELYAVDVIYITIILLFIFLPAKELHSIYQRIDEEAGNSAETYLRCMRVGSMLLYIVVALTQFFLINTTAILVIGPIALMTFSYFVVSFVALGYNISQVADIIEDEALASSYPPAVGAVTAMEGQTGDSSHVIAPDQVEHITRALDRWKAEGGMRDSNASMVSLARRIGVERRVLTDYLSMQHGCTFRIWLSNLRMEEAKRLLLEHEEYSNEVIAFECGFSSASQLYRVFKTATGSTPREWYEKQRRLRGDAQVQEE